MASKFTVGIDLFYLYISIHTKFVESKRILQLRSPHTKALALAALLSIWIPFSHAEEVFLDFNDIPYDPRYIGQTYAVPVDQQDFYRDQGLIFGCWVTDISAYDCVSSEAWSSNPGNKYLVWATQHHLNNNRRMHLQFPGGANDITFEMGFLWEPGKVTVEFYDDNGGLIETHYNVESAEEYSYSDLLGWSFEEYWGNSKQVFIYDSSTPVYSVYIHAWKGNYINGHGYIFGDALDNLSYNSLNNFPPDEDKEEGCENANMRGNPCNAATGNKYHTEIDYSGAKNEVDFIRHYNSYQSQDNGLGVGWSANFATGLELSGDTLIIRAQSGKGETWTKVGNSWVGDSDTDLTLVEDSSGYTLIKANGDSVLYNFLGHVTSEMRASGRTISYTYDSNGNPASMVGPFGHALLFMHDSNGRLIQMIDPSNQTYDYAYDSNSNLISVTYPDETQTIYHYENTLHANYLTGVTDRNSDRIATYTYNNNGSVRSTAHADIGSGPQEMLRFEYDFSTAETSIVDAIGNRKRLYFDPNMGARNLIREVELGDNKEMTQTFDQDNNLTRTTDEENRTTSYTYNLNNQITSMTEAAGTVESRTTSYEYVSNEVDLPVRISKPSVYTAGLMETTVEYDGNFNVTRVTDNGYQPNGTAISRSISFTYNTNGKLTSIDGYRNDVLDISTFTYYECNSGNECGQLATQSDPYGYTTLYDSYDANGRVTQLTDPDGLVTAYVYDFQGRVIEQISTPPAGQGSPRVTKYVYDGVGQLIQASQPDGTSMTYTYNAAHYLTSITDNIGNRMEYSYDRKGNRTDKIMLDANGDLIKSVQKAFDIRDRVRSTNRAGSITQTVQDAVGNLISVSDPNANPDTTLSYDGFNRLTQTTDALANTTLTNYDVHDKELLIQSPNNVVTTFSYDDFGNKLQTSSPDSGLTSYIYDEASNIVSVTDAHGVVTLLTYDRNNRLLSSDYPGTDEDITIEYDNCQNGVGRVCAMIDGSGTSAYGYDLFGNIVFQSKEAEGITTKISYSYDSGDNVMSITYPNGSVLSYKRDAVSRILAIECSECGEAQNVVVGNREYRPDGLLLSQTFGNGLIDSRSYDLQGRLVQQDLSGVDSIEYTYDANGNVLTKDSYKYLYDSLDRLSSEKIQGKARKITYDGGGNRLSYAKLDYTYLSGSNQLIDIENSPVESDVAGNILSIRDLDLSYNRAQRLSTVTNNTTGTIASYVYNAIGQRAHKVLLGNTTFYHYDPAGHLIAETDSVGNTLSTYIWADEMPVAQNAATEISTTTGNGNNAVTTITPGKQFIYLHTDSIDTPRIATDVNATIVWEWDEDAYGFALANQDPDSDDTAVLANLRFPGQYFDAESGLHYNWYRYYDAQSGRYITSDPSGFEGGLNTFAYANLNPLIFIDPAGLAIKTDDCKDSEFQFCINYCSPNFVDGCYVTVSWKIKASRGGSLIRSEQRKVNCNCREPACGSTCQSLIVGGLITAGVCLSGGVGGVVGGLIGLGALTQ